MAGGISVPVGGAFIQMAAQDEPQLTSLTGYAVLGAIFFLISTARLKAQQHS